MACFGGKKTAAGGAPADPQEEKRNKEIENQLKEEKKNQINKMKLLLLGTGDAGKSTFAKQMKVIHQDGFSKQEIERFTDILRDNCLVAMQKLLIAVKEWNIEIEKDNKSAFEAVFNATQLTNDIAVHVQTLWKAKCVQSAFERNNELQLPGGSSGAEYFFNAAKRFAAEDYLPTPEDVIRAKVRTTGITETVFTVNATEFTMVDVGGQRSERRKWLHCFGDVTAVIFLVALNEYDMVLEEDNKTNRMEESLKLFQKLTGSQWFENTSFILFLNKSDLFQEKIKKRPLVDFFEDYEQFCSELENSADMGEFEKSCEYIKAQYIDAFHGVRLYPFITCAIDKDNCIKVFAAVRDTVISGALSGAGL
jgi:GTPase SAR1 family protein